MNSKKVILLYTSNCKIIISNTEYINKIIISNTEYINELKKSNTFWLFGSY